MQPILTTNINKGELDLFVGRGRKALGEWVGK